MTQISLGDLLLIRYPSGRERRVAIARSYNGRWQRSPHSWWARDIDYNPYQTCLNHLPVIRVDRSWVVGPATVPEWRNTMDRTSKISYIDRRTIISQMIVNGRLVTIFKADPDPVSGYPAGMLVCEAVTQAEKDASRDDEFGGLQSDTVTRFDTLFWDSGTFSEDKYDQAISPKPAQR